ncbi:zinc-finger domain-containing protein [Afifella pfennigii]|uniref:zinc-finger domain-containing protein n=1 Tax=Afifella pfennigii TaxID=209897 RepID=UPI00047939DF|nr:zinc-finger domain-containing protein [Afifella pfennigii]
MADSVVPHFHNTDGVRVVTIGSREFMCIGALPPFDHPHVFLDMGDDTEIVCPYCSTLYSWDDSLEPTQAKPPQSVYQD